MRRHYAHAAIGDGLDDLLRLATVQPILVGKVREAFGTASIRTMTLHAVGQVQALAHFHGVLVGSYRLQVHLRVLVEKRLHGSIDLLHFRFMLTRRRPTEYALEVAKTGVEHQIHQREDDGDIEQPTPPLRHRVVVLLKRLVPDVTASFAFIDRRPALNPQQCSTTEDADQYCHDDVPVPELIHKIAHDVFLCSW